MNFVGYTLYICLKRHFPRHSGNGLGKVAHDPSSEERAEPGALLVYRQFGECISSANVARSK